MMKRKIVFLFMMSIMTFFAGQDRALAGDNHKTPDVDKKASVLPPLVSDRYEYRDVCGCCEKDIQCDMMQKAIRWDDGNDYDSLTRWKVNWDYGYKRDSNHCSADSFRITLDIIIQLPRWICTGDVPPQSLKDKWDAYIKNLIAHENSHRDIARQAAEDLTQAVSRMPPAVTCRQLDRELQTLCRERMRKLDQAQQRYDEATGHGFANRPAFP